MSRAAENEDLIHLLGETLRLAEADRTAAPGPASRVMCVIELVGAYRDALHTALLPVIEHQRSGITLGMSVRSGGHLGRSRP